MKEKYKNIYLIGSYGWLGKRLLQEIIKDKYEIIDVGGKINCLIEPGQARIHKDINYFEGNITSYEDCLKFFINSEDGLIINTAGIIHPYLFSRDFKKINLQGTKNLYEASKKYKAKKFIAISSNSPFGANPDLRPFDEKSEFRPYMNYGQSKMEMEKYLTGKMNISSTPITIIRPPWFYGPEQPSRQNRFFTMVKKGLFPIMGDGKYIRSLAYVDSIVSGILLSAKNNISNNKTYWLSDDEPYYLIDIIETIKTILKEDFQIKTNPKNLYIPAFVSDLAKYGDKLIQGLGLYNQNIHVLSEQNMNIFCSNEKIKLDLGYKPICTLNEGMRRSIDWCLSQGLDI
tara:strand:- start:24131 stop:25162 length:1032 start_codon:yes stop_codon:yes gene_type:complete